MADVCSMVNLVCLFMKMHLLALLKDLFSLALLCFLAQVVWTHEEYNSILSTAIDANFYWPVLADADIIKTQI